jgi:MFS transporter, DHA1 family, tetracycline resistance protein
VRKNPALLVIFLIIFIDLLGFGIIIPLLPSFSINVLHINESTIGLVAGIYSLMQFFFTPIWGGLSDRYGRKPILIMSLIGSVISYTVLGFVFSGALLSVVILIVSRAFAGIFSANISAAQAVISDVTTPEERTRGMGLIGAAFALGFVFGPAIGGILSNKFGHGVPVFVAAGLSFVALILCMTIFKESHPVELQQMHRDSGKKIRSLDFKLFKRTLTSGELGQLIIISFIIVFAFSNMFGSFQLFAERDDGLDLNEEQVGYLFSLLGIVGAFVQVFMIKYVKRYFGDGKSLLFGIIASTFGLGLIPIFENIYWMVGMLSLLAFGNSISNTVSLSLVSQRADKDEMGTILGVNQSLSSFARFCGPVFGGFSYQHFGFKSPFIFGGIFMSIVAFYTYYLLRKYREIRK